MTPGCTMGSMLSGDQAGGDIVMLWAMFHWESLGSGIYVVITLTHTYKTFVTDQVLPFMAKEFPNSSDHFYKDTRKKNGLRKMIKISRC